jgi:hypothetical protein
MAGFVLVCPMGVFLVLKFVRPRVKCDVEDLLIFVSESVEECQQKGVSGRKW